MARLGSRSALFALLVIGSSSLAGQPLVPEAKRHETVWSKISAAFSPPVKLQDDFGTYRSPLMFDNGRKVETAGDWQKRREELLQFWHKTLGPWPPLLGKPALETIDSQRRENFVQKKVRVQVAADLHVPGYLLVPDGTGHRPAVVVVFYEPETAIGQAKSPKRLDFAYQLARRGFVSLSIGWPTDYTQRMSAKLQPLSCLAYVAANAHTALAGQPEVDAKRIGIVGHSFGGKWAMFASCLYDKYACAAWSDPGIVFDESRPNVNYWEPWYLGWQPGQLRERGVISEKSPRTGPYKGLIESGHDLHELHMLMAPRPFLVSGGSEDPPERWKALNHSVAVNRLLGCENCVAMTNRPDHNPTDESNEQLCLFFEYFLAR